ncbi:MAG: PAS domain S-box protein, partial [Anaerolineales bacterium]|nr:PAS domain S-box protein [Anaerolineales bacterium]
MPERREEIGADNLLVGSPTDAKSWLGVPMSIGDRVLGALVVQSIHQENLHTEHHRDLLLTIAQQTAVALENSRLFELSQASEANFRNLVENAPEAIIVVDMTTGLITDPNENAERLYGLNRQDLAQVSIVDLSPDLQPDGQPSKEVALEKYLQALEGNTPIFEWTHLSRQGKMLPCEIHLARLPGDHPRIRATIIDITERKFNESIRSASNAIADAALNEPNIESLLKAVHDTVGTLVPAKNFYVSLYDKETDLLNFPYHVDEYDDTWEPQKYGSGVTSYIMKTGKPLLVTPEILKEITTSSDVQALGPIPLEWIGVPLKSGQDLLGVMAIQTYSQDIRLTEKDRDTLNLLGTQVAIAIDRKRTQESVTRSEAELRALFSAMNDVIIVMDRDGKYIRIAPTNPSRLFLPPLDMIGKTVKEILPSHIHEPMLSAIQEALTTGLPVQLEYWLELESQTYWFDASLSRLSADQVFLVAKDITERKKAEEALRRRDEYLAASSEIGRKITATLDLETIFSRAVNLVAERFSLYHTAIYTIEETGFNAVFRDGTGVAGQ